MITDAAIMDRNGRIWTGRGHSHIMQEMLSTDEGTLALSDCTVRDQGFVDEEGRFLTREEAHKHALECGQLDPEKKIFYLTSEDLW